MTAMCLERTNSFLCLFKSPAKVIYDCGSESVTVYDIMKNNFKSLILEI